MSNARPTSGGASRIPNRTSQRPHARSTAGRSCPKARAPAVNASSTASSWAARRSRSRSRLGREHRRDRALRVALGLVVAALERADRGADHRRPLDERAARDAQDELGVGRRPVVVDAELAASPGALRLQLDALHVPERGGARDAVREQRLDGLEADRDRPDRAGVAAGAGDDRAQDRVVGREAGDADPPALEVARRPHAGLREHRRERLLHERHHADEVGALLAREPEVVDVEDREVGAAGLELLQRVGRGARRLDVELDALGLVVVALRREVDPRVHRVGLEVEQQRRLGAGRSVPESDAQPASSGSRRTRSSARRMGRGG